MEEPKIVNQFLKNCSEDIMVATCQGGHWLHISLFFCADTLFLHEWKMHQK